MKRLTQLGVPVGIVFIVVMLVVPLPAIVLDLLIALNITGALLILLTAMFVHRPLDFAAFPAVVLVMTLFRLALNVSATRLVLLDGYAGKVIDTFGHFVVGGSLIVGLIVFAILLVIQFVVITNGAGRVAEVGARFTLDAMPGKQMAIDADLNSGLIDEDEARRRREEVHAEADFYGAMDGASKFVKGDAIAAIIITLVNLIGGFAVGIAQKGLSMGEAVSTYSLLSVGDGLVSQIPALLLSVSTGLIVTRATSDADMGSDILRQLGRQQLPLRVAGGAALALCLIPGLPKLPFIIAGGLMLLASTRVKDAARGRRGGTRARAVRRERDTRGPRDGDPGRPARPRPRPRHHRRGRRRPRRRPAAPGQGAASQDGRRPRHRHPAAADARQRGPAAGDLRDQAVRHRGGPRRGAARSRAGHRRLPRLAARHADARAGLRPRREVDRRRAAQPGRARPARPWSTAPR